MGLSGDCMESLELFPLPYLIENQKKKMMMIKIGSKMRLTSVCMLLLMPLIVSCSSLSLNFNGFLAFVSVDTRGFSAEHIASAKSELIAYVESLGLKKRPTPIHFVEPPDFVIYNHPKFPLVFYNLYLDYSNKIGITIRDNRRRYSGSEELRGEIEGLLELLREKFGEDNVTYNQESTLLI